MLDCLLGGGFLLLDVPEEFVRIYYQTFCILAFRMHYSAVFSMIRGFDFFIFHFKVVRQVVSCSSVE